MRLATITDITLGAWFFILVALNYVYIINVLSREVSYDVAVLTAQLVAFLLILLYIPMHLFTRTYIKYVLYKWLPGEESRLPILPRAIITMATMSLPWYFLVVGVDYYTLYIMFVITGVLALIYAGKVGISKNVRIDVVTLSLAMALVMAYFGGSPIFLLALAIYIILTILTSGKVNESWVLWFELIVAAGVLLASFGLWYWAGKWMLSFNMAHFAAEAGETTPVRNILTDCPICKPISAFSQVPITDVTKRALMVGPFAPFMDYSEMAKTVSSMLFGGLLEWIILPIFFFVMLLVAAFPEEMGFRAPMLFGGVRDFYYAFAMAHLPSRYLLVVFLMFTDPAIQYILYDPLQTILVVSYYVLIGVAILVIISTAGFFITQSFLHGNLWSAIVVHALYNATIFSFLYSDFDYLLFTAIATTVGIALFTLRKMRG